MTRPISIMVAAHKDYEFPDDAGYLPLQVGRAISSNPLPFAGDDTGESISALNRSYCELTGLYWLWKNRTADVFGLVHYRRYFCAPSTGVPIRGSRVASSTELANLLADYDIVLSKPRRYVVETVRKHYANAHYISDLQAAEAIIGDRHPDYLHAFKRVMAQRTLSLYNMFIMNAPEFHAYCEWLFPILFEAQKRIPFETYGPYQGRVFGFLGERLLNVWVEKNVARERIKFLPVVNLEGESFVKKAAGLLERKFRGVKQH